MELIWQVRLSSNTPVLGQLLMSPVFDEYQYLSAKNLQSSNYY